MLTFWLREEKKKRGITATPQRNRENTHRSNQVGAFYYLSCRSCASFSVSHFHLISILIQVRSTKRTPAVVNEVFRLQHLFGRHSILQMELLIVMYLLRFGVCVCVCSRVCLARCCSNSTFIFFYNNQLDVLTYVENCFSTDECHVDNFFYLENHIYVLIELYWICAIDVGRLTFPNDQCYAHTSECQMSRSYHFNLSKFDLSR